MLGAAALDGALGQFFSDKQWRALAVAPMVILYIILVAPFMSRADRQAMAALRRLLPVSAEEFDRLSNRGAYVRPSGEILAAATGAAFGLVMVGLSNLGTAGFSWRLLYLWISTVAQFALLAWTIYVSIAGARMTAALHRLPMQINLFDATAFEAVGRQSLLLALVFAGGITLSLLFQTPRAEDLRLLQFWIVYLPPALAPVAVFFLNMLPTHRILAAAKQRELDETHRSMLQAYRASQQRLAAGQSDADGVAEATLLFAYEQRLRDARTWPYNTTMLRTIFLSGLVPVATSIIQRLWARFFS
jgi:hypothetical protein